MNNVLYLYNDLSSQELFCRRMGQLIDYYGIDMIQGVISWDLPGKPKPENNSYWLTNEKSSEVLKLHLNNLMLTVGDEVFNLGCVVFFDMKVGA